ncbi:hypothetical protein [Streptomyces sp. NPDC059009]|uniref:hypothetical protein n=1 Tax=Streptomyces sp. NPDC059009 TaxID=3346694 RepID=UPI0036A9D6C7
MPEPDVVVTARKISVGREVPESVPDARTAFYRWLGERVVGGPVATPTARHTLYVRPEELRSQSLEVREHLRRSLPTDDRPHLFVVDMAENPYHRLSEPLLFDVARLTGEWWNASPRRSLAILLPALPLDSSSFWTELRSLEGAEEHSAVLTVIAKDGQYEVLGGDRWDPGEGFAADYADRQPQPEPLPNRLSMKIVKRLGHYRVGHQSAPDCRRFFFDVENAVPEISGLAGAWLTQEIIPHIPDPGKVFLLSKDQQMGLHEAVAGIAAARGCRFGRFDADGRIFDGTGTRPLIGADIDATAVLFFAVVDKVRTYEEVIRSLRRQGVDLAPRSWAVMITNRQAQETLAASAVPLTAAECRDRRTKSRGECEQCTIGLPHTDPLRDRSHTLRSYDAWDIFLNSRWGSEKITPMPSGHRFHYAPDLKAVFEEHGGWLAHKIMSLLDMLQVPSPVVFVCPDEAPIRTLAAKLAALMGERQDVVHIPSAVLDHRTSLDAAEAHKQVEETRSDLWQRQLRGLRGRGDKVVILDEFRASGTTARTMRDLLLRHGIEPRALVPIIDFSEDCDLDGLPVHSLYRIRAARSGA